MNPVRPCDVVAPDANTISPMPLLSAFILLAVVMFLLWLLSLALRDVSIVDIFWGSGFVLVAWFCYLTTDGFGARQLLITTLVTIWGLRLSIYLFWRNHGRGEDYRYQAMRKRIKNFPLVSLFLVFGLQGFLIWLISMPVMMAEASPTPAALTWLDYTGLALWLIGIFFESVGDWQLARFKADPANKGKVMNHGLWAYTRHPNYFGDALLWWGIFLIALATPDGWKTILSPLAMTILLLKISGVALLEKSLTHTKPAYAEYIRQTNAFIPWFPRKNA
ncbi:MAG: DUF1295 domain-containing protein [Blastocatellia bacterium]